MTDEQNIVYIQSQIACATIRALGMQAENEQRKVLDQSMAYTDEDFYSLIEEYGIHHNAVIGQLINKIKESEDK